MRVVTVTYESERTVATITITADPAPMEDAELEAYKKRKRCKECGNSGFSLKTGKPCNRC